MLSRCAYAAITFSAVLSGGAATAADSPRAVIEKAVEASGGKDLLNKYPAGRMEFKGTVQVMGLEVPYTGKTVFQLPGRERNEMTMEIGGQNVTVVQLVNGNKVKMQVNGQEAPLDKAQKDELEQGAQLLSVFQLAPLLDDKKYTLKPVSDPPKVDDKETVGVAITAEGLKEVKFYFDKKSGLPLRLDRKGIDPSNKEGDQSIFFKDYKKVQGIQSASKWEMTQDGKKFMDTEVTKMTYLEKADPKEFDVSD